MKKQINAVAQFHKSFGLGMNDHPVAPCQ